MPDATLRQSLRDPAFASSRPLAEWDLLVRQANDAGVLARLALVIERAGLLDRVPAEARPHLVSDRILAEKHGRDALWEIACLERVLAPLGLPVVLLKGGAYLAAGLPAASGRVFGDIDILVPKAALDSVELRLRQNGWLLVDYDEYDQQYYRRWMHQIPPLEHFMRGAIVDVHHTIVPTTARTDVAAALLLEAALPVGGSATLKVLAPADMVLHSATHLLNEGEFDRGLRDLVDLDLLLRHFGADPGFWPAFLRRAEQLNLARPAYYCLRYTSRLLQTPVPPAILDEAERLGPGPALRPVMDFLFERALRPFHASCRDRWTRLALWVLYVRAHYLRMPWRLLVPHLVRKAVKRRLESMGFGAKPPPAPNLDP